MKTVRFSQVVKKAGKPSVHLQLVEASKDRELKEAAKDHRVMTLNQPTVGQAADYGTVGLDSDLKGQVLIFPKSLVKFSDKRVVGIKYEMLEEPAIPKEALAPKTRPKKKPKARRRKPSPGPKHTSTRAQRHAESALDKALAASPPSTTKARTRTVGKKSHKPARKRTANDTTQSGIKEALQALEDGHAVKAYKILKGLVAEE